MRAAATTQPFDHTLPLLQALRARNVRSAIVTRNCRAAVERTLPTVHEAVDAVLARDDVEHIKPDPRHVERALAMTGSSARHSVMVGDGRMDMSVGRELGMHCIGVRSGSSDGEALRTAGAHAVCDDIGGIRARLQQGTPGSR